MKWNHPRMAGQGRLESILRECQKEIIRIEMAKRGSLLVPYALPSVMLPSTGRTVMFVPTAAVAGMRGPKGLRKNKLRLPEVIGWSTQSNGGRRLPGTI